MLAVFTEPVPAPPEQEAPTDDGQALAELYAGILNDIAQAGGEVEEDDYGEMQADANDDGYELATDGQGKWTAKPLQEAAAFAEEDWTQEKGPRGGTRWKHKGTGRVVYGKSNPGASKAGRTQARTQKAKAAGPVQGLGERIAKHKVELTAAEQATAKRSMSALRRHHGDAVEHRIAELVGTLEKAHAKATAKGDKAAADAVSKRIAALGHGMTVQPATKPAQKAASLNPKAAATPNKAAPNAQTKLKSNPDAVAAMAKSIYNGAATTTTQDQLNSLHQSLQSLGKSDLIKVAAQLNHKLSPQASAEQMQRAILHKIVDRNGQNNIIEMSKAAGGSGRTTANGVLKHPMGPEKVDRAVAPQPSINKPARKELPKVEVSALPPAAQEVHRLWGMGKASSPDAIKAAVTEAGKLSREQVVALANSMNIRVGTKGKAEVLGMIQTTVLDRAQTGRRVQETITVTPEEIRAKDAGHGMQGAAKAQPQVAPAKPQAKPVTPPAPKGGGDISLDGPVPQKSAEWHAKKQVEDKGKAPSRRDAKEERPATSLKQQQEHVAAAKGPVAAAPTIGEKPVEGKAMKKPAAEVATTAKRLYEGAVRTTKQKDVDALAEDLKGLSQKDLQGVLKGITGATSAQSPDRLRYDILHAIVDRNTDFQRTISSAGQSMWAGITEAEAKANAEKELQGVDRLTHPMGKSRPEVKTKPSPMMAKPKAKPKVQPVDVAKLPPVAQAVKRMYDGSGQTKNQQGTTTDADIEKMFGNPELQKVPTPQLLDTARSMGIVLPPGASKKAALDKMKAAIIDRRGTAERAFV